MRVGFLQMQPRFGAPSDNVAVIESALATTRDAVVVLPELCTTGYVFASRREAWELSEPVGGPALARLGALARRNRLTLCAGFAERAGRRVFNSAVTFLPSGVAHVYRKAHLFDREKSTFDVAPPHFEAFRGPTRLGVMICFDWFFPEACRALALDGARVVLHPSNLVLPYCQNAMTTRCVENHIFAVTCNRVGSERRAGVTLRFTGRSQVVDCNGRVLVRARADREAMHFVELDPEEAARKRITPRNDLFEDRRPRGYTALVRRSRKR